MGRLFWKILLIVLVSNALVFLATILVSSLLYDDHPVVKMRLQDTSKLAARAIEEYESEGVHDLIEYLQHKEDRYHARLFLLDSSQRPLARPLPPRLAEQINEYPTILGPRENRAGFRSLYAITAFGKSGRKYHFVATYQPGKKGGGRLDKGPGPDFRLLLLLTGIVVSSALIAWLFNRPMRTMKNATRQFAEGKHDTRLPASVSNRRDAIGELAGEFNHMAEQVDALLSSHKRLLRDVSHELRSPLARMQVALSLIEQRGGNEAVSKEHERLQLELERLNELIGQILTLTRLDTGSQVLERENTDLAAMINGLLQDVRYEHSHDSRRVSYKGPEKLFVHLDAARMESAIENVLRNAMKYTRDDTEVRVSLERDSDGCRIRVRDEGPGVPDEALERIFDAFYRTQDARDDKTGGVGVGLAISRRIVELHSGRISAENHPEGGLELTIHLPFTIQ